MRAAALGIWLALSLDTALGQSNSPAPVQPALFAPTTPDTAAQRYTGRHLDVLPVRLQTIDDVGAVRASTQLPAVPTPAQLPPSLPKALAPGAAVPQEPLPLAQPLPQPQPFRPERVPPTVPVPTPIPPEPAEPLPDRPRLPTPDRSAPAPTPAPLPVFVPEPAMPLSAPYVDSPKPWHNSCWIAASYWHAWARDDRYPTLFTLGSAADLVPGALGQANTTAVTANILDNQPRPALKLAGGIFFDELCCTSLEANAIYVGQRHILFEPYPSSTQVVARPISNANTGAETAAGVSVPGVFTGTGLAEAKTELFGAELHTIYRWEHSPYLRGIVLGGARALYLADQLVIRDSSVVTTALASRPDVLLRYDVFTSRNVFYGAQLGWGLELHSEVCSLTVLGKCAWGVTQQHIEINGVTGSNVLAGTAPGAVGVGLLAAASNSGIYEREHFGVVPELNVEVGYQLSQHWRAKVGYTLLYWFDVARAGQQVDRSVNVAEPVLQGAGTQAVLGGAARPAFTFHETSYWVQGFHFGLEFRY